MKRANQRQEQSVEPFDALDFVKKFETEIRRNADWSEKAEYREDFVAERIFDEEPKDALLVLELLSQSNLVVARQVAVGGLARALEFHPFEGAILWNNLLVDPEKEHVGEQAYREFDKLCSAIEDGKLPDQNLSSIYFSARN